MTRLLCLISVLALAIVAPAVRAQEPDLSSPKLRIGWAEFKKLHDTKAVVVVDVRDPDSFSLGHIPGAISIPVDEVEQQIARLKKEKRPLVTYCA